MYLQKHCLGSKPFLPVINGFVLYRHDKRVVRLDINSYLDKYVYNTLSIVSHICKQYSLNSIIQFSILITTYFAAILHVM